jgi:hypothetical protein
MPKTIKLVDLLQRSEPLDIGDDQQIMLRALSLQEMMLLLMENSGQFLELYARGVEGKLSEPELSPFLLTVPTLVAKIIAISSDEPTEFETIEKRMPATVQLIALEKVWKLSVPDPKKAQELLSVVMGQLQKLAEKGAEMKLKQANQIQPKFLHQTSRPQ